MVEHTGRRYQRRRKGGWQRQSFFFVWASLTVGFLWNSSKSDAFSVHSRCCRSQLKPYHDHQAVSHERGCILLSGHVRTDSLLVSASQQMGEQSNHEQEQSLDSKSTGPERLPLNYVPAVNRSDSDTRFASPLLEFGYPSAVEEYELGLTGQKPLLLYLPGFDGTYLSAFFQYPELHTLFDVRCLVSTMNDRSTFDDLKQTVLQFLVNETTIAQNNDEPKIMTTLANVEDLDPTDSNINTGSEAETETEKPTRQSSYFPSSILSTLLKRTNGKPSSKNGTKRENTTNKDNNRPVYLAGESFGGILALEVALSLLDDNDDSNGEACIPNINLQGLVLVNAATCYDRSRLAAEGPPVANLPPLLYVFGIFRLLPMFMDKISLPQFLAIIQGKALPSLIDNPTREAYMGRLAFALPFLLKFMPQETFQWRLNEWLQVGCKQLEKRLQSNRKNSKLELLRTLIIAGENDLTLPSIAEAERLAQAFANSHVHVVKQVGHANTCGTCLDLAAEMRSHFPELQTTRTTAATKRKKTFHDKQVEGEDEEPSLGRTQMKQVAAKGKGIYFGMEPRYDGKAIGLSPLSYWSREYYRKIEGHSPQ